MTSYLAFGLPTGPELIVILVIALLVFGKRLPEVAKSAGQAVQEFKKGLNTVQDEIHNETRKIDQQIEAAAREQSQPSLPASTTPADAHTAAVHPESTPTQHS